MSTPSDGADEPPRPRAPRRPPPGRTAPAPQDREVPSDGVTPAPSALLVAWRRSRVHDSWRRSEARRGWRRSRVGRDWAQLVSKRAAKQAAKGPRKRPDLDLGTIRYELRCFAELAALTGFGIVLPVLGPYGDSPETFIGFGASSRDIVVFALVVAVVPLLILFALAAVTEVFGRRVRSVVQTVLVAILAGLACVAMVRSADVGPAGRVLAGLAAGALVAAVHRRYETGRMFLRYASLTPILLVMMFLFASPVSTLVRPPNGPDIDRVASSRADKPDVVVLVFDELPTLSLVDGVGQIDRERFPNFARFADTSTWYRNHSSVATATLIALPALTTGTFQLSGIGERFASYTNVPDNIFSLMARTHDVHATEWATDLCPPSACRDEGEPTLDQTSRSLIHGTPTKSGRVGLLADSARSLWWRKTWPTAEPESTAFAFPGADNLADLAGPGLEFLSGLDRSTDDRPDFDWLDVGLPHEPWRMLPSGAVYNGPESPVGMKFFGWPLDSVGHDLALATRAQHLLQLQWTDRFLGAVLDRLAEIDRFEDAVVVVTADHGVSFKSGTPVRDISVDNTTEIAFPPLMIKAPGQDVGKVDDRNALSIDLLPTIADYEGIEIPWEVNGVSLAGTPRTDATKMITASRPDQFVNRGFGDLVRIDTDGLAQLKASPYIAAGESSGTGESGLNVYRHGRQGGLVGRQVAELAVCDGGPEASYAPPAGWDRWADGSFDETHDRVPLFHQGSVRAEGPVDMAIAVNGVVAGWAVSQPDEGGNPFAMLLAEPLTPKGAISSLELYEIRGTDSCLLHRVTS
ncbi:MAG: sulfatase [Acidimicrobiales bacterium]|nr:sulfatase [Acidimicrobiales bacterium]